MALVPSLAAFLLLTLFISTQAAFAGPCDPGSNEVICENSLPGNPASEWDVSGAGDPAIQGFATDISVDQGRTVRFKVDTVATDYRLDIYRMGWYGGDGARKVATVQPSAALPQAQPACAQDAATGLVDCGNWAESASWAVPANATSGVYFAKLVREDGPTGASHVVFVVRDDDGSSDLLFQTSDTTWQAYNRYGGNSLYTGSPAGRAYKVSYNRPFTTREYSTEDWFFTAEYPMLRWLEANGYDVSYFTGADTHRRGGELLEHRTFMSVGHDEYWSGPQQTAVKNARREGVNLAFFSGNESFWKTRWENSERTLVSYKETHANAKIDPTAAWTGTWRDARPFNPDGPRPENALTGTIFTVNCCTYAIEVPADDGKMRFWRDTSIASLGAGTKATLSPSTLGYEWDEDLDNGFRPPGITRMSSTTVNAPQRIFDYGSTYGPGEATHHLTLYRHSSGALVFGAGTVQWSWGLDGVHDEGGSTPDTRMRQATVNLFADMGVQPGTLQAGLVPATASLDVTAPGSQVQSPAAGATVVAGDTVTVTGTALDSGGGRVGGVEVSVDGGATWHPAAGRENWSYAWTPPSPGNVTIQSRAVDDSGRLEVPGAGVGVTVAPDQTPPAVTSVSPPDGADLVDVRTRVTARFSEAMTQATVTGTTFRLRDSSNALVPASVTYDPAERRATLDPSASLAPAATYTATLMGGSGGLADAQGNALASDLTWSFTTAPARPSPGEGPGGPILVIETPSNKFGRYFAEILRAEGLNEFDVADIAAVTAGTLANYDVAVLGEMSLNAGDVQMFDTWVNAGGNLVAMRPDKQLAGLLGLTDTGTTLSDAYVQVGSSSDPGAGIAHATMQFHGVADRYLANGATTIATLYSNAWTATSSPAVTERAVGSNGGTAAAFTYDLARSVVYTRQGNPAWAGQERDGQDGPIRSNDLFYGAAAFDPRPDWIDLTKVAIPQADEQQRLFANLIGHMNADRKPLPRFWFLPRGEKAAIVMTGDDHGSNGTAGRFNQYKALSPPGCSVAQWECVRSTSYIYPNTPLTDAQAAGYEADGFEVGLHVNTNCANWNQAQLESFFSTQLGGFDAKYTSLQPPATNRTHCVAWSEWATQPKVELANRIHLDTSYYYWPASWIQNQPGMFTGSGSPMRFADLDGGMVDVYQAPTQMTDESGQSYPLHVNALLDRALGPEGYYGVFTANMHTDNASSSGSDAIVAAAQSRDVPVVSGRQMLQWLDARNSSSFESLDWDGSSLTFSIDPGQGANGLRAMVPVDSGVGPLTGVKREGVAIATTTRTVKGIDYAFFDATAADYEATYGIDDTPPVISDVDATPGKGGTAAITWTTDEASRSRVDYGTAPGALSSSDESTDRVTEHRLDLGGLAPNTTYHFRVTSTDATGNASTSPPTASAPATFTTPSATLTDTTTADFGAGTPGASTHVAETDDGEVILTPAVAAEFSGTGMPLGWSATPWSGGGSATVNGGHLTLDEAHAGTDETFGPGHSLEFVATFGGGNFQHVGFSQTFNELVWAIFSIKADGLFYARTANDSGTIDTPLPSGLVGAPHQFRIDWKAGAVDFYVDGSLVASHATTFGAAQMRAAASDLNSLGARLSVDWMRLSPHPSTGTFVSRVLDAGTTANWGALSWTADTPPGTAVALEVRTGDSPTPNGGWSAFSAIGSPGGAVSGNSRYVQYRATLTTNDPRRTPVLEDVDIAYAEGVDTTPPTITARNPAPGATAVPRDTDVTVQFSEPMDAATIDDSTVKMQAQGAGIDVPAEVDYDSGVATLDPDTPLQAGITYEVTVDGTVADRHGNALGSGATSSFETVQPATSTFTDTTSSDFEGGLTDSNAYLSESGNGEVSLTPAEGLEFSGKDLPDAWSGTPWSEGGSAIVDNGTLTVDGSLAGPNETYGPGHSLEFAAAFGPGMFQHVGFSDGFQSAYAIFSTFNTTNKVYARTNAGAGPIDTEIPGVLPGTSHRFRIDWDASDVRFFVDDELVATHPVSFTTGMWPAVSDFSPGGEVVVVDWLRMSPYATGGTFQSRVFDAGASVPWGALSWTAHTPSGTSVALSARTGNVPVPDGTWSAYQPIASSGGDIPGNARYVQYRAELGTTDSGTTPELRDVTIGYTAGAAPPGYPRPRSATKVRVPLVVAFARCTSANRVHGPSLAYPSCAPPAQVSPRLTVGTPDANGAAAASAGFVQLSASPDNPGTPANEADISLRVSMTDVRRAATLSDYTGEVAAVLRTRMTDRLNGPDDDEAATVADFDLTAAVPCTATAGAAGATCSLSTTVGALQPGSIPASKRTVRELRQVRLFDGGSDDLAATAGNSLFAVQGVFVP